MKRASIVLLVLGFLGCLRESPSSTNPTRVEPEPRQAPSAQPAPTPPAVNPPPSADRFGEAITLGETTRLTELARNPTQFAGRSVRTEGTVSAVCQSMGCWMEIQEESSNVHVRMHGHSFFIPRNARGRHAVVQANVIATQARPSPQGNGGSCAGGNCAGGGNCPGGAHEGCGPTPQAVASLELDAVGVELR